VAGNRISVTDPNGHETDYGYDPRNELISVTDALTGVTGYSYDPAGNLASVTDPDGNVTNYTHDAVNRLTVTTDPNSHTTTNTWNAGGELVTVVDRDGRERDFSYDNAGRRTEEDWIGSGSSVIFSLTWTYDADSRLTGAGDAGASYTIGYDSAGRMSSVAAAVTSGPSMTLNYFTDPFRNNRGSATVPAAASATSTMAPIG